MSMLLSLHPSFPLPPCVLKSIVYVCLFIPALQLGSSVPLCFFRFHIYALAYGICFSLTLIYAAPYSTAPLEFHCTLECCTIPKDFKQLTKTHRIQQYYKTLKQEGGKMDKERMRRKKRKQKQDFKSANERAKGSCVHSPGAPFTEKTLRQHPLSWAAGWPRTPPPPRTSNGWATIWLEFSSRETWSGLCLTNQLFGKSTIFLA